MKFIQIFCLGEEWGYEGWEMSQPDNDRDDAAVTFWWNPRYKIDAAWKWNDTPIPSHHSFIYKSYLS